MYHSLGHAACMCVTIVFEHKHVKCNNVIHIYVCYGTDWKCVRAMGNVFCNSYSSTVADVSISTSGGTIENGALQLGNNEFSFYYAPLQSVNSPTMLISSFSDIGITIPKLFIRIIQYKDL